MKIIVKFNYSTTAITKCKLQLQYNNFAKKRASEFIKFSFLDFTNYLRKVFETSLNDYIRLAECGKIYTSYFQERRKQ